MKLFLDILSYRTKGLLFTKINFIKNIKTILK